MLDSKKIPRMIILRSNKETVQWLKEISWRGMTQEKLQGEANSFFGVLKTNRPKNYIYQLYQLGKFRNWEKMQCTFFEVIYSKLRISFTYCQYMWLIPHMFGFSHTCVVISTYYTGSSCVALTTQVCFIAHTCGNNQACVVGFFPHMFGKTPT